MKTDFKINLKTFHVDCTSLEKDLETIIVVVVVLKSALDRKKSSRLTSFVIVLKIIITLIATYVVPPSKFLHNV